MCVCAFVHAFVHACVRACVHARVRACVRACVPACVRAGVCAGVRAGVRAWGHICWNWYGYVVSVMVCMGRRVKSVCEQEVSQCIYSCKGL